MATDVERLVVRLEGRIKDFERSMLRANSSANKAATGIERRFVRTNAKLRTEFAQTGTILSRGFGKLGGFGAALGVGGAFGLAGVARGAVTAADTITEATNQIRAAFAARGITDNVDQVREKLLDLAVETRSEFGATVQLFSRLTRATESINAPVDQVIRAVGILNKAFQASGATSQEAANGVRQLAQGLASGALQGDELRSIRENAPVIAKAIADSFGVGIGALKQLGAEGKLTAEAVFPAILAGGAEIERQFAATDVSISKAFAQLQTRMTDAAAKILEASGATEGLTQFLTSAADAADRLANTDFTNLGRATTLLGEINRRFEQQFGQVALPNALLGVGELAAVTEGPVLLRELGNALANTADEIDESRKPVSAFDAAWRAAEERLEAARTAVQKLDEQVQSLSEHMELAGAQGFGEGLQDIVDTFNEELLKALDEADVANALLDVFEGINRDAVELIRRLGTDAATALDFRRVGDKIETELNARLGTTVDNLGDVKDAAAEAGQSLVDSFGRAGSSIQSALDILNSFFLKASNPPTPLFSALGQTTGQAAPTPLRSGESVRPLSERGGTFANDPRVGEIAANTGATATNTAQTTSGVQALGPEFGKATSGIPTAVEQGADKTAGAVDAGASSTVGALDSGFSSTVSAIGQAASTIVSGVGAAVERGITAAQGGAFATGSGPLGTRPGLFTFSGTPSPDISAGNIAGNITLQRSVIANMKRYGASIEQVNNQLRKFHALNSGLPGNYYQNQVLGAAEGGPIRGPGTGKSDDVLMWGSNGEFMMQADAVNHYGVGFMDAVNDKRLPKFAGGGAVGTVRPKSDAELRRIGDRVGGNVIWEDYPHGIYNAANGRINNAVETAVAQGLAAEISSGRYALVGSRPHIESLGMADTGSGPIVQGPGGLTEEELAANEAALRRFADAVSPTGRSSLEGPRQVSVDRSVNTPVNVMIEGVRRDEVEIIAEMVFARASRELATRLYLN